MVRNRIHLISFHFVVQSRNVERFGRVGKFSSQHCIHVDPTARKKGHCQSILKVNTAKNGGLMVSVLDSGSSGPGSSSGRCRTLLCSWARLNSHSASLHPGV